MRAGLAVVADAGRLIARHWPVLLLLALAGFISRHYLLLWAVEASALSGVLGRLVMSLVVFTQLVTIVGALLVMRGREASGRPVSDFLIAAAAVILPFLVIYEHYGYLYEDTLTMGLGVAYSVIDGNGEVISRLAGTSTLDVLLTAIGAFAFARVATAAIRRTPEERARTRAWLRLAVGYAEVVWIFLGATIVREASLGFSDWWHTRRLGAALDAWWLAVQTELPSFAGAFEWLWAAIGAVVSAALVGFVVPLAWLALGALVYGAQPHSMVTASDVKRHAGRVIHRVRDEWIDRGLELATDPERRFGGAVGAVVLVLRAGWAPVLVFCLAFLVADRAEWIVPELARVALASQPIPVWNAWIGPLEAIGTILQRILTLALVASAVDALMRHHGAPAALRLRHRALPVGPAAETSTQAPAAVPYAVPAPPPTPASTASPTDR